MELTWIRCNHCNTPMYATTHKGYVSIYKCKVCCNFKVRARFKKLLAYLRLRRK